MRINRKFKGAKAKDNKGYLKSNSDNFTPYKEIDGGDITMKGVDMPLLAIPMDADGKPMGMKFMKPGKEYEFGGAHKTMEVPTYQKGGKTKWISEKVAKLIGEGYPQAQAVAVANEMFEKKRDGGSMEYMQGAGMVGFDLNAQKKLEEEIARQEQANYDRSVTTTSGSEQDLLSARDAFMKSVSPTNAPSTGMAGTNLTQYDKTPEDLLGQRAGFVADRGAEGLAEEDQNAAFTNVDSFIKGADSRTIDYGKLAKEDRNADFANIDSFTQGVDKRSADSRRGDVPTDEVDVTGAAAPAAPKKRGFADLSPEEQEAEFAALEDEDKVKDFEGTEKFIEGVDKRSDAAAKKRSIEDEQDFQFFNPYQGVDLASAANLFGQGIGKGGDPKMAVAAGAKLALGLGRNVVSGLGTANANQFGLDEYNERKRKALIGRTPTEAFQKGGELTDVDRNTIREEAGFEFNDQYINEVFEKVQPAKKPASYDPSLGRYKDVNYFDNARVQNNTIKLQTTKRFPGNIETMDQYADHIRKSNPGYDVDIQYIPKSKFNEKGKFNEIPDNTRWADTKFEDAPEFQEGGSVDSEAMLTGNYSSEDGEQEPNVEVEVNEYILTPSGSLTKVLGDNHENGGEKMKLEEGTRIVSDHLKVKGPQAKMLKKEFDIDVSAKDTYAKAIDKFYKKSGLQSIIDEEAEVIKTIKTQKEKMAEEGTESATRNINLEFLSSKLNDLDAAKKPLIQAATMFFDKTYELQEQSKPAAEADIQYQVGGQVYNTDQIVSLGKKYNMSPEEAIGVVKKLQPGGPSPTTGAAKGEGNLIPLDQSLNEETGLYGDITPEQFEQAKLINNWFNWENFDLKNKKDIERFQREFNKRSTGAKIKEDGKFGIQTQSVLFPDAAPKGIAPVGDGNLTAPIYDRDGVNQYAQIGDKPAAGPEDPKAQAEKDVLPGRGVYLTPDQELLPPGGMVPSTKIERTYGRMDAERFTPDQQLAELNRSVDAAMSQLEALPSGQREAAIVQMQANKQQQTDKIISDVEKANKQIAQNEQAFNIRQADREVDASAIDTLSFEQRSLGAMANTEDDFRRYFNEGQRRNVEKFKEIENLNFINALYENFDITPEGIKNTVGSGMTDEDYSNMLKLQYGVAASKPAATTKTKKAYGGRVRFRRI